MGGGRPMLLINRKTPATLTWITLSMLLPVAAAALLRLAVTMGV
jgi:hypothetical protein